jgi:putative CocE/NonD family hydrolase
VLHVHGLFDQEDSFGALAAYEALAAKDPDRRYNFLAVGPWSHGQSRHDGSSLGPIKWGSDTSLHFRRHMLKPFLDQHLKGRAPDNPLPRVMAFETGPNEWRASDRWPLGANHGKPTAKLYLLPAGRLGFDAPESSKSRFAEYLSHPAKPTPHRHRPIRPFNSPDSGWAEWLVDDQRDISTRPDVLSFRSEVLTTGLTISGEVIANLMASTTGSDVDWVVKLIDVYPPELRSEPELGGYELMISADIMRGRYREDMTEAKPIEPGEILRYRVRMPAANHTFLPGHRIMVQIQSSWFPLYDRNPQTFVPEIARAPARAYKPARQRIYFAPGHASYVELPVVA